MEEIVNSAAAQSIRSGDIPASHNREAGGRAYNRPPTARLTQSLAPAPPLKRKVTEKRAWSTIVLCSDCSPATVGDVKVGCFPLLGHVHVFNMSVFIGPSPKVLWEHERIIEQELASIARLHRTVADMLLCFLRSFLFLLLTLRYLVTQISGYCNRIRSCSKLFNSQYETQFLGSSFPDVA